MDAFLCRNRLARDVITPYRARNRPNLRSSWSRKSAESDGGGCMSARESIRESLRIVTRDYSLVGVAIMFVIFGLALSNNVIPNYHELQELTQRKEEVSKQVETARKENETLQDQINALDDPYYITQWMVDNLNYRPVQPKLDNEAVVDAK